MAWETSLTIFSVIIASFTLYNQFHKIEIIAYPLIRDTEVFLVIENTGNTLVKNFTVELVNRRDISDSTRDKLEKMPFLKGKIETTMASKTKREIPMGSYLQYIINGVQKDEFLLPVFEIEIKTKRFYLWHKTRKFKCDYNTYTHEEIVFTSTYHLKNIDNSMKYIVKQLEEMNEK